MLDDFNLDQNIVYKTLINSVKKNKVSHAYLIESNGYYKAFDLALSFAKYLLCPNNYSNSLKCGNCHQCENINKNEFLELKIINPDGQWIKKSQLEELQDEFSKKSIIGTKKVYIINQADKLNTSSANSLLKFLEEPNDNIIAILIVENISQAISTIVSRCQVLPLKKKKNGLGNNFLGNNTLEKIAHNLKNNNEEIINYINEQRNKENLDRIIEFIEFYEENHLQTLIYTNKLWHAYFTEREELSDAFNIMILFYKDLLNFKLEKNIEIFTDYISNIKNISQKNNLDSITNKINVIVDLKEKIKFNVNQNMLIDKLIIELEGCEKHDRSSRSNV